MCEPISLISAGLAVAGAVNGAVQQKKAQKEQNRVRDDQFAADTKSAEQQRIHNIQQTEFTRESTADNYQQNSVSREHAQEQAGQKIQGSAIDAARAAATARTSGGESGYSVVGLTQQIEADKLRYNDSVNSNLQDQLEGFDVDNQNTYRSGQSQINGLQDPRNVVMGPSGQAPDYIGAGLKIGGAVYGANKSGALDPIKNYITGSGASSNGRVDNTLF